ncbi:DUF4307 domain-containing protein [Microbacterium sp. P01]|uniref:DUF4307 domain-containing protein n=1 Tax=unclassified Microbacterium TaxID=2609290 RepID=UPI003671D3F1
MTTQEMLDERYGRVTPRGRRVRIGVISVIVAAVVGGLAWLILPGTFNSVGFQDTAFELRGDHSASITFQISAPDGAAIACALEAQDEDHGTVGWKIVQYEASDRRTREYQETIPTVAAATTGFVNNCWVT